MTTPVSVQSNPFWSAFSPPSQRAQQVISPTASTDSSVSEISLAPPYFFLDEGADLAGRVTSFGLQREATEAKFGDIQNYYAQFDHEGDDGVAENEDDFYATFCDFFRAHPNITKLNFYYEAIRFETFKLVMGAAQAAGCQIERVDLGGCHQVAEQLCAELNLDWMFQVKSLSMDECSRIKTLSLKGLTRLEVLSANFCRGLTHVDLGGLTALKELSLNNCLGITSLNFQGLPQLQTVSAKQCRGLTDIENLEEAVQLNELDLTDDRAIETLNVSPCKDLKTLILTDCRGLTTLTITGLTLTTFERERCLNLPSE